MEGLNKIFKRITLLSLVVLFACGALSGCRAVSSDAANPEPTVPAEPATVANYTDYTERILTELEAGKVETLIEYGEDLILSVHYPSFNIGSVDQAVQTTVNQFVADFRNQNKGYKARTPSDRAVLNVDFATYVPVAGQVSVLFKISNYAASLAHPSYQIVTQNYNLKTGQAESVANLCTGEYLKVLSDYCDQYFRKQAEFSQMIDSSVYLEGIAPKPENYQTLIFRATGVEVLFQPYQVFAGAMGIPSVLVPLEVIQSNVPMYRLPEGTSAKINDQKPMVALTFDDGPHKQVTTQILDALKKVNGHATFFVIGKRAAGFPEIIQRIVAEGSEVGNHSYNHPSLAKLPADEIKSQISLTDSSVEKACGVAPKLIRPTYGAVNDTVKKTVNRPLVLWSIDTKDWETRNRDKTVNAVLNRVKDGDIILMHDIYTTTGDASAVIIPKLAERGYQLVTVSELLEARGKQAQPGELIYYLRKK